MLGQCTEHRDVAWPLCTASPVLDLQNSSNVVVRIARRPSLFERRWSNVCSQPRAHLALTLELALTRAVARLVCEVATILSFLHACPIVVVLRAR